MDKDPAYTGYLTPYLDRIRAMHGAGHGTREIADALYAAGARANTSAPGVPSYKLTKAHHIKNLRVLTLFALKRLGLRTRTRRNRSNIEREDHEQI